MPFRPTKAHPSLPRDSPFFLVYETEVMGQVEVMMPSLKVIQARKNEKEKGVFTIERFEDLEGLDEKKEEA